MIPPRQPEKIGQTLRTVQTHTSKAPSSKTIFRTKLQSSEHGGYGGRRGVGAQDAVVHPERRDGGDGPDRRAEPLRAEGREHLRANTTMKYDEIIHRNSWTVTIR